MVSDVTCYSLCRFGNTAVFNCALLRKRERGKGERERERERARERERDRERQRQRERKRERETDEGSFLHVLRDTI